MLQLLTKQILYIAGQTWKSLKLIFYTIKSYSTGNVIVLQQYDLLCIYQIIFLFYWTACFPRNFLKSHIKYAINVRGKKHDTRLGLNC